MRRARRAVVVARTFSGVLVAVGLGACAGSKPAPAAPPAPAPVTAAPAAPAPPASNAPLPTAPPPLKGSGAPLPPPSAAPAAAGPSAASRKAVVRLTPPSISGRVDGAEQVTASLRGPFEDCYRSALEADPAAHGKVMLVLHVAKDGSVSQATNAREGASEALAACLTDRAKQVKFASPTHGTAIIAFGATLRHVSDYADEKRVHVYVRNNARECFRSALRINPHIEGDLSVELAIDDKGQITHATATPSGTLPKSLASCVEKNSHAQFKPGPATVVVPVHLALKAR